MRYVQICINKYDMVLQALGFDVGVMVGTLNNRLKQNTWNTAVKITTQIWKMDQYMM
jgi:uncharacterized membrane-anchored protein YhcB (DUF1043 family)